MLRSILAPLRPAPHIPTMPWSAGGPAWRAPVVTLGVLCLGLCLFGLAAIFRLMTLITPNAQTVPDTS